MIHTFTQQVCLCANQEQVLTNSVKEFVFLHGGDTSSINKFFEWASHCKALIGGCTYQKTLKSLSPRLCKMWRKQELQVRSSRLCMKPDRDANTCWCIYSFCRCGTAFLEFSWLLLLPRTAWLQDLLTGRPRT